MKIVLASKSPRRKWLLERLGITDFEIRPSYKEEKIDPTLTPAQQVEEISRQKAEVVAAQSDPDDLIIAGDTLVVLDGQELGKPHSPEEAVEMLRGLSGQVHTVYTGFTVRRGDVVLTEHEITAVRFRPLSEDDIAAYMATGEPMDKAGAYGIQGIGAVLIEAVRGDYYNVMGLPLCHLSRVLAKFGVDPLKMAAEKGPMK